MLPPEAIKEYRELYLRHYGIELSVEEAALRANNLVNLYKAVYISGKEQKENEPNTKQN